MLIRDTQWNNGAIAMATISSDKIIKRPSVVKKKEKIASTNKESKKKYVKGMKIKGDFFENVMAKMPVM